MPVVTNRNRNDHEEAGEVAARAACVGRNCSTPTTPSAITTKFQNVTRAPPSLSASQPPNGRTQRADQRAEPGVRERVHAGKLALDQQREAGGVADEGAEGAEVQPAHQPVVLAPEDDGLVGERGLGVGEVVHAEPGEQRRDAMIQGTQMKPAFCSHICAGARLRRRCLRRRRRACRTRRR